MTLLARALFYFRCETGHRFTRGNAAAFDDRWCPKCGMTVRLYGLKDDTRYAEEMEGVPGEELSESGS